jgi:hypothetical protein
MAFSLAGRDYGEHVPYPGYWIGIGSLHEGAHQVLPGTRILTLVEIKKSQRTFSVCIDGGICQQRRERKFLPVCSMVGWELRIEAGVEVGLAIGCVAG